MEHRQLPPALRKASRAKGPLRTSELEATGVYRAQLSRWASTGVLQKVERGLYALPDYEPSENAGLITVARKAPKAVLCLLTALQIHGLTTQAPFEVWIAVNNASRAPRLVYPPVRVVRFSGEALTAGVETLIKDGVELRVTGIAKTIADCFKFRNKIGLDVALEALREARRDKRVSAEELWRYAKVCRVANVMRPYLEATA